MNLVELGAIGELVGGLAVLATLVYLTVQVRQARSDLAQAGIRARAETSMAVVRPLIDTPELSRIWAQIDFVDYGDYGLDAEDTVRFGAWCHCWMQAEQARFYTLPESTRASAEALRMWWLTNPHGREFWHKNKGFYDDAFVAHMADLERRIATRGKSKEELMAGDGR